jgi:hypothetical protein
VHVSWHGLIAQADLDSFSKEMPRIGRGLGFAPDVLHTFEAVTGLGFDPAAAYQYSHKQRQVEIPNPIRAAMVVTTKESEYLATVFMKLNRAANLEMQVFFDEASARHWLARE